MPNLTTVGLTAGAGSSGTGTVSTLDNVIGPAGTPSANVQTVQGVTSMTPLKVDGSAVTQPVSNASLPLPTGASTAALQPTNAAQGAAIAAATGHLMQGSVTTSAPTYTTATINPLSMDTTGNLRVNVVTGGTSGAVAQGSTTSGQTGSLIQGAVTTAAPSYTTAQTSPLSLDTAGNLRVNVIAGGAGGGIVTQATGTNLHTVVDSGAITATLAAETTKVIGVTRTADGAGNLLTSTSNALDINIKSGANPNGRALPASSAPVVMNSMTYKSILASQTAALFGATGATGDYLDGVLIVPATAAAGAVTIQDAGGTAMSIFAGGGTTALPTLAPFYVPIGAVSSGGAGGWKVTTGTNVSVIGVGNFT